MPRKLSNALTPLQVKNAKPGRHADGGGLHLLVKDSGARSWVFRFMLRGKARDIGLSRCPEALSLLKKSGGDELSLAQARDVATIYRLKVKAGIDPLEEREQEAAKKLAEKQAAQVAGITFKAVAEAYLAANQASWKNAKHRQQWRNTLETYVYPRIGSMPVADIGTAHVLEILEPIWSAKPETASRIRGRIETVLDAAKAREYRQGENPARWRGHIAQILPKRTRLSRGHHKAMPYEALPAFVARLRTRQAMAALALEFAILTAMRTEEVLGATWGEIDLIKALWIIPAARMKAENEHRVPLSPRAVEILETVKALGSEFAFPSDGGGKLSSMAMLMLLRRMGVTDTVHGFRSSFRDWAGECTSFPREVCEMALSHTITNKAEAAYWRRDLFDKRRRLMEAWASYCSTEKQSSGTVTPIRGAVA
ncbi:MAG: integrase arm-type DNA-binding domain-containing protein [Methylobacterium sp.]|jgi:integrase|nr:integrase arm-type DNA-binding domain-containing protein [Methylobacterium sp.]MCA3635764.1 integrase arm-type DNA-binding domain-containing protein [Methylobacterium sp.]MCA3640097.1 integrase arm-type DNA-binding domain-containing protein [Methylobacterium sp.]